MEKFKDERNTPFSVILGLVSRIYIKYLENVILGFIPRIHAKQNLSRHYRACPDNLDTRDKPEYDKCTIFKGLDVVCQCAALLERRVQSGTRAQKTRTLETVESGVDKVVSSCEKNPNTLLENLDVVRQCAGIFKRRVQKEYTSAKISSRHQLNEFSLGRSMIEMLGVLAIIGVLSIGGIAGYSKAMEKIHVNKIVNMISDISATIRTAYISQKTYDGFDGGTLGADNQIQDMGLLPPEYIFELEGEKMIGLSSPLTLINPVGYGDTDFSTLSIGVLVPQNLCVPLLTYDWRNADMKGIVTHVDLSDPTLLGVGAILYYANIDENGEISGHQNCDDNDDDGYFCIETKEQRFKPVSPAAAAKYCESSAADSFGTGQMYVGFDLLADIKVPRKY